MYPRASSAAAKKQSKTPKEPALVSMLVAAVRADIRELPLSDVKSKNTRVGFPPPPTCPPRHHEHARNQVPTESRKSVDGAEPANSQRIDHPPGQSKGAVQRGSRREGNGKPKGLAPEERAAAELAELQQASEEVQQCLSYLRAYSTRQREGSDPTFVYVGKIGSKRARILVDTGASTSFIDEGFVRAHGLSTSPCADQEVELASGIKARTAGAVLRATHLEIRTSTGSYSSDKTSMLLLPLGHYDVILGDDWIRAEGACLRGTDGTVELANGTILTAGEAKPPPTCHLMSISALRRAQESKQLHELYLVRVTPSGEVELASPEEGEEDEAGGRGSASGETATPAGTRGKLSLYGVLH